MSSPAGNSDRSGGKSSITRRGTEEDITLTDITTHRTSPNDRDGNNGIDESAAHNIDNPFLIHAPHALDGIIEATVNELGLRWWLDILQRGASIARDRMFAIQELKANERLSPDEETALEREENTGFWRQSSRVLRGSMVTSSLGAMVQGWTESAFNGANLGIVLEQRLRIDEKGAAEWKFAILNAAPLLAGAIFSPLLVVPLQDNYLGRRGAIFVSSLLTLIATIASCWMSSLGGLIAMRILIGIALGAKASVIPIYGSEISPARIRGRIGVNWQIMVALGVALGFTAVLSIQAASCVPTEPLQADANFQCDGEQRGLISPKHSWRLMTATILIPDIILLVMVYFSSAESPYWKLKKGLRRRAFDEMKSLRINDLLAAKDFIYTQALLDVESRLQRKRQSPNHDYSERCLKDRLDDDLPRSYQYEYSEMGYWKRFSMLFRDKVCRRALICASWAMASQQLTGINTIAFLFFPLITRSFSFEDLTKDNLKINAYIGFAFGLVNFSCGLPAYWLADRVGRATLMLFGLPIQAALMLVLGLCFLINHDQTRYAVCGTLICFFTAVYSFTTGPCAFAIASEVFPLSVREVGMAVSVSVNFFLCGLVLLLTIPCNNRMGENYVATACIFAALNLLAFVGVVLWVPETKGRKLEELQFTFDLETSKHVEYRLKYELGWWWRTYVLRKKTGTKIPFYRWARQKRVSERE